MKRFILTYYPSLILAIIALGLLALRFVRRDLAPFLGDEPYFLAAARQQLLTGNWVSASPLIGTQGIQYGPGFIWFLSVVQWLTNARPETAALVVGIFLTAAHVTLAVALARIFRGGIVLFAILTGLLASAPFQYFWARLAWDQPFVNGCIAFSVALLCTPGSLNAVRAVGLGITVGFAVATHLVAASFAIVVTVVLVLEARRGIKTAIINLGSFFLSAGLICLPYAIHLYRQPRPQAASSTSFLTWSTLIEYVIQPVRVATTQGISYWFDDSWPDFLSWAGLTNDFVSTFSNVTVTILVAISVLGLTFGLTDRQRGVRRLILFALGFWLFHVTFSMLRNLPTVYPHYQSSSYWIVLVGISAVYRAIESTKFRTLYVALLSAIVIAQSSFIGEWTRYNVERWGTRNLIPIAEQRKLVRTVCALPESIVFVPNETSINRGAFDYIASTESSCARKRVRLGVSKPKERADAGEFRVLYDKPLGGKLKGL